MILEKSQEIIEEFTNTIKDLRPNLIVQSENVLPYLKGKIKYAHFVMGEELIKDNKMTKEIALQLMNSYGIIDSFFVEEPESINKKYREYIAELKKGIITDFCLPNPFGEHLQVLEYQNFI